MRFLPALTIPAVALFGACTTTLGSALDTWVGAPVDEFVDRAGIPEKEFTFADGRVGYTWDLGCKVTMITTETRTIQSWSSKNCLSVHPIPGKWRR